MFPDLHPLGFEIIGVDPLVEAVEPGSTARIRSAKIERIASRSDGESPRSIGLTVTNGYHPGESSVGCRNTSPYPVEQPWETSNRSQLHRFKWR